MVHAFPCGTPALDFVGTLRARRNPEPREMLTSPESLDAWFRESGMVHADTKCDQDDLDAAMGLREAVYALVRAGLLGQDRDTAAVALVNDTARTPSAVPQLTAEGRRVEATPRQALSSLARQVIDILSGPEGSLLKECGRPECTQVYIDRSRGSRREWCAMETCGNRVKAAAYRARKKASGDLVAAGGDR
ncbi:CGNR zinc finger domain-containing protein [Streptomyces sp. NPDC088733]|uniref:CGNR zinc finger domain-containing protein n=1 Tax=Streptomyces sp. NPDC088733 TaxID=3365880 RepID=UPI0037F71B0A